MTTSKLLPTPEARNHEGYQVARGKQVPRLGRVISSLEASHASHLAKLDREKERQITVTSGQKCLELSKNSIQDGSLRKMLADSLLGAKVWFSSKCVLTWRVKVTKSNRLLFQLFPSMRPTEEIESGLLLTPSTSDRGERSPEALKRRIEYRKSIGRKTVPPGSLSEQISTGKLKNLIGAGIGKKLRLQPAMTEWMMGYPEGWVNLPLVTPDGEKKR